MARLDTVLRRVSPVHVLVPDVEVIAAVGGVGGVGDHRPVGVGESLLAHPGVSCCTGPNTPGAFLRATHMSQPVPVLSHLAKATVEPSWLTAGELLFIPSLVRP